MIVRGDIVLVTSNSFTLFSAGKNTMGISADVSVTYCDVLSRVLAYYIQHWL